MSIYSEQEINEFGNIEQQKELRNFLFLIRKYTSKNIEINMFEAKNILVILKKETLTIDNLRILSFYFSQKEFEFLRNKYLIKIF